MGLRSRLAISIRILMWQDHVHTHVKAFLLGNMQVHVRVRSRGREVFVLVPIHWMPQYCFQIIVPQCNLKCILGRSLCLAHAGTRIEVWSPPDECWEWLFLLNGGDSVHVSAYERNLVRNGWHHRRAGNIMWHRHREMHCAWDILWPG